MKNINKKTYSKPSITLIKIDNQISFVMMTNEDSIPDNPPWDSKNNLSNPKNNPYKEYKV